MQIMIQISPGELLDKVSILQIKREKITNTEKLHNIETEIQSLSLSFDNVMRSDARLPDLYQSLLTVNKMLWEIEDRIREHEERKDFLETFVELARSVYINNDRRSEIKREINTVLNSDLVEEKSYRAY